MINTEENSVYDILNLLDIKYKRYEHKAIYTIEEANDLDIEIPGQQCKNLFLRNKKGKVHYLIILDEKKIINLKDLSKKIGSTDLSFASEERLDKYLGLKAGSVTPFGLINDDKKEVIVIIDEKLNKDGLISFHPNVNTATISLSYLDFEKFIKEQGNEVNYVDIE